MYLMCKGKECKLSITLSHKPSNVSAKMPHSDEQDKHNVVG